MILYQLIFKGEYFICINLALKILKNVGLLINYVC